MPNLDVTTLVQLGPLAVVLLYIVIRLEGAINAVAQGLCQVSKILLLLLRHVGVDDELALDLCAKTGAPSV